MYGISSGVSRNPSSRLQAFSNPTVVSPTAKPRRWDEVVASGRSSLLRTSRTVGMSSLRYIQSKGTFSEASMIWLCAGTSIDDNRNDDPSHRYSVPPRLICFRHCTKMLRLGSLDSRSHGVDDVRW